MASDHTAADAETDPVSLAVIELQEQGWKIDDADRDTVWMTKNGVVIKIEFDGQAS